jgi:hypothetical protein
MSSGFKGTRQNGRTLGTQNKTTKEIRELFKTLLERNLETLEKDLNELDPKDRITFLLKLSAFVIPTLRSVEVKETNLNDIEPITFVFGNENNN